MKCIVLSLVVLPLLLGAVAQADVTRGIALDIPDHIAVKQLGAAPGSALSAEDSAAIAAYRFREANARVLVVLVEWTDRPHTYSRETVDSMFFSRNVYPSGSIADYYAEVSYGQVNVTGTVLEWMNAGFYPDHSDFESLLWMIDPSVDFSQYDGNGDGDVDAVVFLRAGPGQEDTHDPNDIWSYALIYGLNWGPGPFDGKYVSHWNTSPEIKPLHDPAWPPDFTGEDTLNDIRVFCHELAHNFGLPDLYDYDAKIDTTTYFTPADSNDHPVNDWCVMGYGGYGIMSIRSRVPSHLCGWNKAQAGWIEPVVLEGGTFENVVIYDIETHADNSLFKIPISYTEGEYFLLEYRNPNSTGKFDKIDSDFSVYFPYTITLGGDPLDRGLIITHVHDSLGAPYFRINYGLPRYPHYTVAIEDAGYNPARDMTTNPEGYVTDSAQWWYPYETQKAAAFSNETMGQEIFSPTTTPSSDGYFGPTGIIVRVDSIIGDKLYAYVHNPASVDVDEDGVANAVDNCIATYNPMQEDLNMNGTGDVCEEIFDYVSTTCTNLMVSTWGNAGSGGIPGYSLDYSGLGDCEYTYLLEGSPILLERNGGGELTIGYNAYGRDEFLPDPWGRLSAFAQDSGAYAVFRSASVKTATGMGMERIWYAPKQPDTCQFVIQCLRVYTSDLGVHDSVVVGELADWDVPWYSANMGGYDAQRRLLYQNGIGSCNSDNMRYGGMAVIGKRFAGECVDSLMQPFGGSTQPSQTYVYPTWGLVPSEIYGLMQSPGYTGNPNYQDQFMLWTLDNNLTIGPTDTVEFFTVLASTRGAAPRTLPQIIDQAKVWFGNHVACYVPTSCCNKRGDVNDNGTVNVADLTYLVNYLFKSGPTPVCFEEGDVNGNGTINVADLTYLVNYLFKSGPLPPSCP